MIGAIPVQNKIEQEQLCKKCNIEFIPNALCYSCNEDGDIKGVIQFSLKPENAVIYNIGFLPDYLPDSDIIILLGRAPLNFIDLAGIKGAYFLPEKELSEEEEKYAKIIGYKKTDGKWHVNLEGFFDHPCSH